MLLISTAGQLFCTTACLTSASRKTFAFSRDGAIPGSTWLAKVHERTKIPANAVVFVGGSTAWKWAAAIALSFSSSVPLSETVAIERRI